MSELFKDFARVWTAVMMSEGLPTGRPVGLTVAGTPVVFFRGPDGKPAALLDRCPHRGVALSLGTVHEGRVECPFHGWALDGQGRVCNVPWNPDAKLDALRGVSFPVVDLGGQLWLYTAPGPAPDEGPQVQELFVSPEYRVSGTVLEMRAHWSRVMENMLDWPHLPYVHTRTIGSAMRDRVKTGRMDISLEREPWGARTEIRIDGKEEKGRLDLRWPNQMNLFIPIPKQALLLAATCVPVNDTHTRLLLVTARRFLRPRVFDWFFNRMNLRIAQEDKAVVESSFPVEIPPARDEQSVRTDGPTLYFRKRYFAELKAPNSDAPPARRALPVLSDGRASS